MVDKNCLIINLFLPNGYFYYDIILRWISGIALLRYVSAHCNFKTLTLKLGFTLDGDHYFNLLFIKRLGGGP